MQQLAMMLQRSSCNDAVVRLSDGDAFLTQRAIDLRCPDKYRLGHGQHDQWAEIALNAPMGCVISNALKDLGHYDAAQGKIFAVGDGSLQRRNMLQITTREEVYPDAGVDQNH